MSPGVLASMWKEEEAKSKTLEERMTELMKQKEVGECVSQKKWTVLPRIARYKKWPVPCFYLSVWDTRFKVDEMMNLHLEMPQTWAAQLMVQIWVEVYYNTIQCNAIQYNTVQYNNALLIPLGEITISASCYCITHTRRKGLKNWKKKKK